MHLSICAIFKNEAPYLREWIEFHRLVGVEQFHLYQNYSEDDYPSVLCRYIEAGVVHVTDWPRQPPCQVQAYQHFIALHKGEPWWVAFLDCDEFLFSPCHATISEAIEAVASPEWGAIGVNWMCFGASGQEEADPRPVIERFTLRPTDGFQPNRHIKTIARMDRVQSTGSSSHVFETHGGTFSELGQQTSGPFTLLPTHSRLRINHYHTKSRQEYLRRIARGNADGAPARSLSEFEGYQAADIDDRAIWRFLPALKERLNDSLPDDVAPGPAPPSRYDLYLSPNTDKRRALPRDFASFSNFHKGETMLVCGCGSSLTTVIAPERFPTIGVNDVGRLFDPDYLVVINPRSQFSGDRFHYVEGSAAHAIFTQLELGISHSNIVRFQLGKRGGTDISDSCALPYTRNSPYVALCLAIYMGAKRIGLIGVDFTEHHFFASTGRHSLAGEINQINREYAALAQVCTERGVEVFNLSPESRLTAFPKMSPEGFVCSSLVPAQAANEVRGRRVLLVNYRFLSCGEVFSDGLEHAAEQLGIESKSARWDDSELAAKLDEFKPDLLFVVHGRNYSQRWRDSLHGKRRSAVWLLDEPYEVDDTSRFSRMFDATFVCDPGTLDRHRSATFLPVGYDPANYWYRPGLREQRVGFVGGSNPAREQMLKELARRGLLSYAIGGPWRTPEIRQLAPSANIPAVETAKLYRQTQIIVNVFRTAHHYNRGQVPAVSMNPRIYEALACGCVVVSERRPEIQSLCPEMPVFSEPGEMVSVIEELLADPVRFASVRKACIRRLAGHTYAHRLYTAFNAAMERRDAFKWVASSVAFSPAPPRRQSLARRQEPVVNTTPVLAGWEMDAGCVEADGNEMVLHAQRPAAPGSEAGLIGTRRYAGVQMAFEVQIEPGACFLAKIHQIEARNQASNSYHLMVTGKRAYLARHHNVFGSFPVEEKRWHAIRLRYGGGWLTVEMDGKAECQVKDSLLGAGYCFLGIKSGVARIRGIRAEEFAPDVAIVEAPDALDQTGESVGGNYALLYDSGALPGFAVDPVVSIITTVYDRVACLETCIRSVQSLSFDGYEHILVADAPPSSTREKLRSLAESNYDGHHRLRLASLRSRANDWGITPAAAGLSLASGKYVCFLSDDNGYKPDHLEKLVTAFNRDPTLGFVYSGCLYDGRATLNSSPPSYGRIDLGQPLFRRDLFERYLGGTIPFRELAWDWKIIQRFMQNGVRWKHIGDATFIFRISKYPHLMPPPRQAHLVPKAV